MACGLPIIATQSGGAYDQVVDGVNGYLCPLEASAIGQRIKHLDADRELLRKMGDNARLTVRNHFSMDTMVRAYSRLFSSLRLSY